MNLITLSEQDFLSDQHVKLEDRRFIHIKNVLKAEKGKKLRVGLMGGSMGWGQIVSLSERQVEMSVELNEDPPESLPVQMLIALPRPKTLPRIIQALTTLGVKKVGFVNTWKVEKCFWSSDYLSEEVLNHAVRLGLEQAMDTIPPKIEFFRRFKPFIEDDLDLWSHGVSDKRVCHLPGGKWHESPHFVSSEKSDDGTTLLALGPEGGFIDYEVEKFMEHGFQLYALGQRVLKLETAIPALVSRFSQDYKS